MIFAFCWLLETQDDASHAIGSRYPLLREKNTPRRRVQCFGSLWFLWGLQRHQAIPKTFRFESLWSLAKKEKRPLTQNTGATVSIGFVFCLPGGTTCFFWRFAVRSAQHLVPIFNGEKSWEIQNPAGFDDKSARSWSFSTGGVLKISMGFRVPGTPNNQFKMDVFFRWNSQAFPHV